MGLFGGLFKIGLDLTEAVVKTPFAIGSDILETMASGEPEGKTIDVFSELKKKLEKDAEDL